MTRRKYASGGAYRARLLVRENVVPMSSADRRSHEDIFHFLPRITGYELAPPHYDWLKLFLSCSFSTPALPVLGGDNFRLAAPRGSAKTTLFTAVMSWIIGKNPHIRLILCSYAEDVALAVAVALRSIFEREDYQRIFPNIRPSRRWRDKAFTIDRSLAGVQGIIKDPTCLAVGMNGAIASRRSDLIWLDDPIRSSKQIRNPQVRADMRTWWNEVLLKTLVPSGRVFVSCTRYRLDDIHGTEFLPEKGWKIFRQKAIVERDGVEVSFWEDYMSLAWLQQQREKDPLAFETQMQNEPVPESARIIFPEWIQRLDIPSRFSRMAVGVDLAGSGSNYKVGLLVGVDKKFRPGGNVRHLVPYHAVDFVRGRYRTSREFIRELLKLYKNYYRLCDRFSFEVESVAYQSQFASDFKAICLEMSLSVRVNPVTPKGEKGDRLYGFSGVFEDRWINFNRSLAFGVVVSEIVDFGFADFDDCVDAFTLAMARLYVPRPSLEAVGY